MKNFLFVVPRFAEKGQYYVFPIGLAYLVSYMKHNGFNVHCLNLCHHSESIDKLIADSIERHQIDVLCTGAMSFYWNEVEALLDAAKRVMPTITTVAGGALVTSDPKLAMENLAIDIGVVGEGEETMVELASALCQGHDLKKVNGLIYRSATEGFVSTEPRGPILDLDLLPFPDYEALEFDKWLEIKWGTQPSIGGLYYDVDEECRLCEIITSRSCPFSCTFCYHPLGTRYRQRSLDNVFEEINFLVNRYRINLFNMLDELFSLDEKRICEFTDRIKPYNVRWMAQWRANNANEDIFRRLKEAGILVLGLGVESMSDRILKSMNKKVSKAEIEMAYATAMKAGVRTCSNIILGDPAETEETVAESISWWKAHPEYDLSLGFILAVPDAPLWRYALERNLIKDKARFIKDKFPVINLTRIDNKKFDRLKNRLAVYSLNQTFTMKGKFISSQKSAEPLNGKNIYRFSVECPLCANVSKYKHYRITSAPHCVVVCKHCYKRLKIRTKQAFPHDYNAFWGFAMHHGFIIYSVYLKKFTAIRTVGRAIKSLLERTGFSGYGGWLGNRS